MAQPVDRDQLAAMGHALWPDASIEEHGFELAPILEGKPPGTCRSSFWYRRVTTVCWLAFLEVGLRSHADGCDIATPVGYVEGWFVSAGHRRKGIGAALLAAAQDWASAHGWVEIASDTWIDNEGSQRAHEALGFEVVDRCVNYRKRL